MDKKTLISTFEECVNNLLKYDFPLPLDYIDTQIHLTHKTKYFGICRHKVTKGVMFHQIGINANFAENGTDKAIINTIYHELLHTLPECQNHGKYWRMYANKVNRLFGLNVCRVGGDKTSIDLECLR